MSYQGSQTSITSMLIHLSLSKSPWGHHFQSRSRLVHYQHYRSCAASAETTVQVLYMVDDWLNSVNWGSKLTQFVKKLATPKTSLIFSASASEVAVPYSMVHPGHEHSHAYYDTFLKLTQNLEEFLGISHSSTPT